VYSEGGRVDEKLGWLPQDRLAVKVPGACCVRDRVESEKEPYPELRPNDLAVVKELARFTAEFAKYEFRPPLRESRGRFQLLVLGVCKFCVRGKGCA
jgi:hypothetical protein